jgi:hypothetical protein
MTEMILTRAQVQQLATFFALDLNVHAVTITESHDTGIGTSHRGTFHRAQPARDYEADITDVSNW